MKNFLATVAVIMLFVSCERSGFKTIFPEGCSLQAGDLVFRRGNGLTSRAVLMADKRGGYSHVGIVVDSCGTMMIVHAVPGEPDFDGDPDRVKMETPEKFFLSLNAKTGEVKRLKGDSATAAEAARYAVDIYKRGVLFDHDYDDTDTTKMYCCELIEHVYKKAGLSVAGRERHDILLPGMRLHCILPSDLCDNARFEKIVSF